MTGLRKIWNVESGDRRSRLSDVVRPCPVARRSSRECPESNATPAVRGSLDHDSVNIARRSLPAPLAEQRPIFRCQRHLLQQRFRRNAFLPLEQAFDPSLRSQTSLLVRLHRVDKVRGPHGVRYAVLQACQCRVAYRTGPEFEYPSFCGCRVAAVPTARNLRTDLAGPCPRRCLGNVA
jgi:hypothetical protein